tara:strand:- start:359 stop:880 length:522 start_codon:yes stop_codon:yes gene_type:complete
MMQKVSSAATSRRQVPAMITSGKFDQYGGVNLDVGGGAFEEATQYLKQHHKVTNLVLDPYNRTAKHNAAVVARVRRKKADSASLFNVLNVIGEKQARLEALRTAKKHTKKGGPVYISVYIREGTNRKVRTRDGIQLNRTVNAYLPEVKSVFDEVVVFGSGKARSGTGFMIGVV